MFSFKIFFIVYRFTIRSFFDAIADFFLIALLFSNNLSSFIQKGIYIYFHQYLFYMHSFLELICIKVFFFFHIFVTNKIFKTLFTERDVNLDIVYQNKDFMLVNFVFFNFSVTKPYSFCIFLSILYILSKFHIIFILYDVPPFYV